MQGKRILPLRSAVCLPDINEKFDPSYTFDTNVMGIDLFPGLNEHVLRHQLNTPGVKGIVIRTYGTGNGPTSPWFLDAIKETVERGVVVVNVTQCTNGGVHPERYLAGDTLAATGVTSGYDLTFEAAITKMMFLLGLGLTPEEVRHQFSKPIAGEITVQN